MPPTTFSADHATDVPGGETLRRGLFVAALVAAMLVPARATGQLVDSLDAYPPRWSLQRDDCGARVLQHDHENDPAAEGTACESVSIATGRGTQAILIYPIEPIRPIDALTASLAVKCMRPGVVIGFSVRYPYLIDPETRRGVQTFVFGAATRRAGEFQRIGVGDIEDDVRLRTIAMRRQYGASADVSSPYVDGVVVNAYTGPGQAAVLLDDLRVDAMLPLVPDGGGGVIAGPTRTSNSEIESNKTPTTASPAQAIEFTAAFPVGRVTRVLQYNGEPLAWVRSLGIDAIWVDRFASADLLTEAVRTRMNVYCRPPSSPDPMMEPLLQPIAGWIVGGDTPMDSSHRDDVELQIERLRAMPSRWRRPLIGSPVEDFRHYGGLLDAAVLDGPPRHRGLSSDDTRTWRWRQMTRMGDTPMAVGMDAGPPAVAVLQSDAIAARIGTPPCESFRWQSMWRQVADAIPQSPSAIVYRSSRSLASGSPLDQNRGLAISFINRQIASLQSWIARGVVDPAPVPVTLSGQRGGYSASRMVSGSTTFLVLTSAMIRGDEVLSGDGKTLRIDLPASDQGKLIWRLTHFSAERMNAQMGSSGTAVELVSPDVVEILAISSDVAEGGRLAQSFARFAQQASLDRWQLVGDSVRRGRESWRQAAALRVTTSPPSDLLQVAASTLQEAETLVRAGDHESALRLSRRADAWCLKSEWSLAEAIGGDPWLSSPPMLAGNVETQLAWLPLLRPARDAIGMHSVAGSATRSGWGDNLLASGDLNRPESMRSAGWSFGRRHSGLAAAEAMWTDRGAFAGGGALAVRVLSRRDDPLPGGYEGTAMLVRCPPVGVRAGDAVRIDAVVRTVGFGQPHQGLLIHDSIGTQAMGVLVRDRPDWTPVTLVRHAVADQDIEVMIEVLGDGEAVIDEIQVRVWRNEAAPASAMRPIRGD